MTGAHWAAAVLRNGLGRYADAMAAAAEATRDAIVYVSILVVPELVEAAARAGNTDVAAGALQRLAETTQPSGNDLALGVEARCRALLSEGETAEGLYQEAIDRLGRTQLRPDLARATCCTASGCAARTGASMGASSCGPPMTCSPRSA